MAKVDTRDEIRQSSNIHQSFNMKQGKEKQHFGEKASKGSGAKRGRSGPKARLYGRRLNKKHPKAVKKYYAALDLGTNNCRLLIVRPFKSHFEVVDSYSRIVRLGQGVAKSGVLGDAAMVRTIDALKMCQRKMAKYSLSKSRFIATQACRQAENTDQFLSQVKAETGLRLEVVSQKTEAKLATIGCAALFGKRSDFALIFDVGGGSSEFIWIDLKKWRQARARGLERLNQSQDYIVKWLSLPVGVVTLSETYRLKKNTKEGYEAIVKDVAARLKRAKLNDDLKQALAAGQVHYLGTSGTITSLAGQFLQLERYDRSKVDAIWLKTSNVRTITKDLLQTSLSDRQKLPCIGAGRADLIIAGSAILEAMFQVWPAKSIRVADRGLREGILINLIANDKKRR